MLRKKTADEDTTAPRKEKSDKENERATLEFSEKMTLRCFLDEIMNTLHIIEDWDAHDVEVKEVGNNLNAEEESI